MNWFREIVGLVLDNDVNFGEDKGESPARDSSSTAAGEA
jgi:hypothetical protein